MSEQDHEMVPVREGELQITLFRDKEIRKICHDNEWFFSIVDVIEALTESPKPANYWLNMKTRDRGLAGPWTKLKMAGEDGRARDTECANTEDVLRVIQSIPSPKAERFKRWLAKVGFERIQEFQNPEIGIKRAIVTYKIKGYDDAWIDARVRSILSRRELTDEWRDRGVTENWQFAALTDTISTETFDVTTQQHKDLKGLRQHHNLRDSMTDMELILTMLGEKSTTQIARKLDAQGMVDNKKAARAGGKIAGNARRNLETALGTSVVSPQNQLQGPKSSQPTQIAQPFVNGIKKRADTPE